MTSPPPVPIMTALMLAIRQLGDGAVLTVLAKSLALTLVIVAALGFGLWHALFALLARWPTVAEAEITSLLMAALVLLIGWILFRLVAIAVIGLFSDSVVAAVERRHYPAAAAHATAVPLATGARLGLQSAGRAVGYNLVALPFYIALLVTGVGTLALLWGVNALVLGKDLEAMVRARHPQLAPLTRAARWTLGGVASALFFIPVANLLAPIVAAAFAVHRMHVPETRTPT
ncbi:MAG: hypothetical protein RLZZ58_736 [Pseudomonadota bacterium]